MRIDGRFDPKAWVQPRKEEVVISTNVEEQSSEHETELTVVEPGDTGTNFETELETSYAYTHASRTAATVAEVLEKTPDL
jgi:hypothetical protein